MNLFALTPMQESAGQIALAAVLAIAGFGFLLPQPRGRRVAPGIAALIAAAGVFVAWLYSTFGQPMPDIIGTVLFCFFSVGALGFGSVLVAQVNPGRGAIAFAFVILSTCGLFLLLAAPFLMAATIIIYAGAIIVTFLFVLMLSHAGGPSDENNRSREPWLGSLAGFAFVGLVLFSLYLSHGGPDSASAAESLKTTQRLPAQVLTADERNTLLAAVEKLDTVETQLAGDNVPSANKNRVAEDFEGIHDQIGTVVGSTTLSRDGSVLTRLEKVPMRPGEKLSPLRTDQQAKTVIRDTLEIRKLNEEAFKDLSNNLLDDKTKKSLPTVKAEYHKLREELVLLAGVGQLPARNVGNLGYILYADHLLAVELAGTLLLVATIGAIAIAQRKGAVA
ncbi:MAG: NADH-quinone oxidoreductase subunit J [Planctomycetes bacterium]|nr:NADH-quinone oxidoreductase subunit J [Planctomycetota bacterium]